MFRRLLAVPAALLGVLGAHEFSYRLVAVDASHRHALLDATGHSWLASAPLLIALALVGLVIAAWSEATPPARPVKFHHVVALQSISYVLVEVAERVLSGHSPWPGLALVIAGAVTQLPAAALVWFLLRRAVVAVVRALRSSGHGPGASFEPLAQQPLFSTDFSFTSFLLTTSAGRAPPVAA